MFRCKLASLILYKPDKGFKCDLVFISLENILNSSVNGLNKIGKSDVSSSGSINWPPVSSIDRPVKIAN